MKKLKKLSIKNFQSHKDTVLEFDDHVNIFVGDSNAGKSVIMRALEKVYRDEPSGGDFVSNWADVCTIEASNDECVSVERSVKIKPEDDGSVKVVYHHYKVSNIPELFTGFGRGIPQEVCDALGLPLLIVGDSKFDINFSDQHNAYFLVLKSHATDRVRLFSFLSHTDVIETLRADLRTEIRSMKISLKADVTSEKDLSLEIETFSKFQEAKPYLVKAHDDIMQYRVLQATMEKLYKLKEKRSEIAGIKSRLFELRTTINRLDSLFATLSSEVVRYNRVKKLHEDLIVARKRRDVYKTRLPLARKLVEGVTENISLLLISSKKRQKIEAYLNASVRRRVLTDTVNKLQREVAFVSMTFKECEDAQSKIFMIEKYLSMTAGLRTISKTLENTRKDQEKTVLEFSEFLLSIKRCPICGTILDDDKMHEVIGKVAI